MSNLRVINTSPREEQPQSFTSIHAFQDEVLDDSPVSTLGVAAYPSLHTREAVSTMSSPLASSPPAASTFGNDNEHEQTTLPMRPLHDVEEDEDEFELDSFNLKPPPPPGLLSNSLEALTDRFFSADHLNAILRDQSLAKRFSGFLSAYLPQHVETLKQYQDVKKIMLALDYANATANSISLQSGHSLESAAKLDTRFDAVRSQLVQSLVEDALPAHLTHQLVSLVTDTLVKEITGNSAPVMRELVPSLAEVYCISDPSLPDNPIVYASEGKPLPFAIDTKHC